MRANRERSPLSHPVQSEAAARHRNDDPVLWRDQLEHEAEVVREGSGVRVTNLCPHIPKQVLKRLSRSGSFANRITTVRTVACGHPPPAVVVVQVHHATVQLVVYLAARPNTRVGQERLV